MKKSQGVQKKSQAGIVNSLVYLSQEAIRNGQTELHEAIQSVVDVIFDESDDGIDDRKKIIEFFQRYRRLSPQAQKSILHLIDMFEENKATNVVSLEAAKNDSTKH